MPLQTWPHSAPTLHHTITSFAPRHTPLSLAFPAFAYRRHVVRSICVLAHETPPDISPSGQIMSNHLFPQPVGHAPRARRKPATMQPTSAVQTQILPWPTLPAASAPSCDSRHRLASYANPQAHISTPATDAFPARTTTTRCRRKIPPTDLPKLLQLLI